LAELLAARFRVFSEPMRLKLLDRLRDGEASVQALQEGTGGSQQNVSKHLGVLLSAGLVTRERHGNLARYAVADPAVFDLCEQVCGGLHRQLAELQSVLSGAGTQ